jgi:hypothetical protein
MLKWLSTCLAGYVILELLGTFIIPEWSAATKSLFTRAGIVVTYLSAITAGLFFYWDTKACENIETAVRTRATAKSNNGLLLQLRTEVSCQVDAQVARNNAEVDAANLSLQNASKYVATKPWLGKLSIAGVLVGSYLQFLGAASE